MATLSDTWSLRCVYAALGFKGTTLPRDLSKQVTYAGMQVTCEPSNGKRNRLYRVYVTCTCGKQVAFCKFPYHVQGKRHKGDTWETNTPETRERDLEHLTRLRSWGYTDERIKQVHSDLAYLLDASYTAPCLSCGQNVTGPHGTQCPCLSNL